MNKQTLDFIVIVSGGITFLIPIIQLSIGFNYVVKDGSDAAEQCEVAPDLPLILAIGGIFELFFLGTAYALLKIIISTNIGSDMAGKAPKILIGFVCFIFGSITTIFFILMQIRVYDSYAQNVQFHTKSVNNYCLSAIMGGALAMVILTYFSLVLFAGIFTLVIYYKIYKQQAIKRLDRKMISMQNNARF